MGLLRYEGDWDPEDWRADYTREGVEPPEDEYADVKRWAAIRNKAKERGLTDGEYDRFVHGMADFDDPEAKAVETGDVSGLERRDVSPKALLREAGPFAGAVGVPFAIGSGILALKKHPKAALGTLAAGAAASGLGGKLYYDAEKARRNEYNSILDRVGRSGG